LNISTHNKIGIIIVVGKPDSNFFLNQKVQF